MFIEQTVKKVRDQVSRHFDETFVQSMEISLGRTHIKYSIYLSISSLLFLFYMAIDSKSIKHSLFA